MVVRVLVVCMLLVLCACAGREDIETTRTPAVVPSQDPATATRVIPTPTLKPRTTPSTTPTATITSTPTISSTSTPESVTKVELTVGAANMRLGAGTEFAVVAVVSADEAITLLETNLDETWYRVRTADGLEGWVGSSVARLVETED